MKRELKLFNAGAMIARFTVNCRAYPDEKGIETLMPPRFDEVARLLQSLSR